MYTKFNQNYRGSRPYRGKVIPFPVDFCKFMYHEYTNPNQIYRVPSKVIPFPVDLCTMNTQNLTKTIEVRGHT